MGQLDADDPLDVDSAEGDAAHHTNISLSINALTVTAQGEDFGGGLGFPFYGFTRPSIDYYQSNLANVA